MASFIDKPAYGTYTVNTGHAKCPNYLYMLDEGSGSPQDRGKAGAGAHLTLTNATWSTIDLTAGGATSACLSFDGTGDYATGTGISFASSICIAVIFATNDSTPTAIECIAGAGESSSTAKFVTASVSATGTFRAGLDDSQMAVITDVNTGTFHDAVPHMVMAIAQQNGGNGEIYYEVDRGAISASPGSAATTGEWSAMNQIRLGAKPGSSTTTDLFTGKIAAVFVFKDDFASWTTAWFQSLYDDPWQFLNTSPPVMDPTMGRCIYILP